MAQDPNRQSEELDYPERKEANLHQDILNKGRASHGEKPQYGQVQDPPPAADTDKKQSS
ncbi:hypothetical protein [Amantichitinum ursilacus]|uniref:Uncharacterized protein n=1 Tax=Amantichitinum ursilacus TaxID=857265 RepID=A0A0N0GR55_9NEIS|nr:hypothetical protein [Amantichitinum ursilacus]KPC55119.1 hypothetical protein WG78_00630 [Amantichitinum ursilacus]